MQQLWQEDKQPELGKWGGWICKGEKGDIKKGRKSREEAQQDRVNYIGGEKIQYKREIIRREWR